MTGPPSADRLERGLLVLALCGGNARQAEQQLLLLDPPVKISHDALGKWKTKYAERYAEIHAEHVAELEAVIVQQVREAILVAGTLQSKVLAALLLKVDAGDMDAKDLANVLKSAGVTLGINVEKMLLLTNRPTVIAEKRDITELLQSLARRVPGLIVDGTAEDIVAPALGPGTKTGAP